jgi:hypothetical protein
MLVFADQASCEAAISTINQNMGFPSGNTSTWDIPNQCDQGWYIQDPGVPWNGNTNGISLDTITFNTITPGGD